MVRWRQEGTRAPGGYSKKIQEASRRPRQGLNILQDKMGPGGARKHTLQTWENTGTRCPDRSESD
eukprot:9501577-Pyramimonas_sp.AAC.1